MRGPGACPAAQIQIAKDKITVNEVVFVRWVLREKTRMNKYLILTRAVMQKTEMFQQIIRGKVQFEDDASTVLLQEVLA